MDFSVKTLNIVKQASQCLVIAVYQGRKPVLSDTGAAVDRATRGSIEKVLAHGDMKGKAGSTTLIYNPSYIGARRLLLLGMGKKQDLSAAVVRSSTRAAVRALEKHNVSAADFTLLNDVEDAKARQQLARAMVVAGAEVAYRYHETLSGRKKLCAVKRLGVIAPDGGVAEVRLGVNQGAALASGLDFTKTISNLPGNICTPSYLAQQARDLQKSHGLKTTVLDEAQMEKLGMGSLLSVSRGSREPAKLIIMEYRGGAEDEQPVVLVGKGLTFDAGGISIKPAAAMDEMKYDMCGGASVFGALIAASEMALPMNVVGIVPSSENLPDGAANKPGDIVTSMAGKTIEILNTDAEGRLILCDALTYAERYDPAAVIDVATLTGACIIALGHHASGLFANDEELAQEVLAAGQAADDRAWQLPVWDDYTRQLKSNFADLANIGGRSAGSVTAACFLKEFTENYPWVHLDVAGTAWKSSGPKGATGRPVPLLVAFLMARCGAA